MLSAPSKETLLTLFLFCAPSVSFLVKDQGEKAAVVLPLSLLLLGLILKALHLGEGVSGTQSCLLLYKSDGAKIELGKVPVDKWA